MKKSLTLAALFAVSFGFALLTAAGCATAPEGATVEERQQAHDNNLDTVDKLAAIAEKHGLAYTAHIHSSGRPSVGASTDFYLNTGVEIDATVFGNAAAGRQPKPDPVKE